MPEIDQPAQRNAIGGDHSAQDPVVLPLEFGVDRAQKPENLCAPAINAIERAIAAVADHVQDGVVMEQPNEIVRPVARPNGIENPRPENRIVRRRDEPGLEGHVSRGFRVAGTGSRCR